MTNKPDLPTKRQFNLPLALTLGAMITLGIITTTLGFVLWPEPKPHLDESTEGWPKDGPNWSTRRKMQKPPEPAPAPMNDAGTAP